MGAFDWEIWIKILKSGSFDFQLNTKSDKRILSRISHIGNPCQEEFQLVRSATACSTENPKIQILRSKSGFPNRRHPVFNYTEIINWKN